MWLRGLSLFLVSCVAVLVVVRLGCCGSLFFNLPSETFRSDLLVKRSFRARTRRGVPSEDSSCVGLQKWKRIVSPRQQFLLSSRTQRQSHRCMLVKSIAVPHPSFAHRRLGQQRPHASCRLSKAPLEPKSSLRKQRDQQVIGSSEAARRAEMYCNNKINYKIQLRSIFDCRNGTFEEPPSVTRASPRFQFPLWSSCAAWQGPAGVGSGAPVGTAWPRNND